MNLVFMQMMKHEIFGCVLASSLWTKGQGRLIHILDFINEEDGQLVLLDADGKIIDHVHVLIYPGSNGEPWWDTKQLLAQINAEILIFHKAHPDCQALFIF